MAMPALVTGSAPSGVELRETRTGTVVKIPAGTFSRSVPPGNYTIRSGATESHLSLLAGGRYEIQDLRRPIDMVLTARSPENGEVRIEARLRGSGSHKLDLRAFNGEADVSSASVNLTPGREETATWKLKVVAGDKPWAIVVIPDKNMSARQELSGTLRELPKLD
jgi:hypothetical protein